MRDALMTERSGPACIILRRVKKAAACKKTFSLFRKLPRFGVPEEIRTPDPRLRSYNLSSNSASTEVKESQYFQGFPALRSQFM